ncbi:unnamed protein product [Adineta ricciae]|uniref:Uncharacterized protein n=1 Tax=Adineta ricciae TaxID=249248 RepID=A0A813QBM6_ADIRI|nr:unnamed protein product [Adineta ricciae]CAF1072030.1 unnamed protein product [Adineta ricciae]
MSSERIPLSSGIDSSFYAAHEVSARDSGTSGIARRIVPGLTIVCVLFAAGSTIYGSVQAESAAMVLPFTVVLCWTFIHCLLLFFSRKDHHEFHPPAWFLFVSSGHIFIQSLIVIILTLFTKST